jgi:hypothetical protein
MKIEQYDIVELIEDLNPKILKGFKGTILEKYSDNQFEIEFVNEDGSNVLYNDQFTFTVTAKQIKSLSSGTMQTRKRA